MRKTIGIIILAVVMAAVAFLAGRTNGIRYSIENSEIWTEGSLIVLDLDGQVYEYNQF